MKNTNYPGTLPGATPIQLEQPTDGVGMTHRGTPLTPVGGWPTDVRPGPDPNAATSPNAQARPPLKPEQCTN